MARKIHFVTGDRSVPRCAMLLDKKEKCSIYRADVTCANCLEILHAHPNIGGK